MHFRIHPAGNFEIIRCTTDSAQFLTGSQGYNRLYSVPFHHPEQDSIMTTQLPYFVGELSKKKQTLTTHSATTSGYKNINLK